MHLVHPVLSILKPPNTTTTRSPFPATSTSCSRCTPNRARSTVTPLPSDPATLVAFAFTSTFAFVPALLDPAHALPEVLAEHLVVAPLGAKVDEARVRFAYRVEPGPDRVKLTEDLG